MQKNNSKHQFSARLNALFKEKKLTLAQVANAVSKSVPSIHRWTRGGEIDYENLRALANFLEVNWIWLRYGDEAIEEFKVSINSNQSIADERQEYLGKIMENEARMNLAQEMAGIATWEWNVLTNELTGSPNLEQVFGQPLTKIRPYLLPFEKLSLTDLIHSFNDKLSVKEWDFNLPQLDSEEDRWFVSRAKLLCDAQNRPIKMVAVSIDITERKKAQKALQKSEYLLRKVIETIPVGLCIADQNGHITEVNPEAERIWGGVRLVDLGQYEVYTGWWEDTGKEIGNEGWSLARAVKHGEVIRGEVVNIKAFDGTERTIIMSAAPLMNENNKIIGAIEVNQDITDFKNSKVLEKAKLSKV